ncbi:hypothetical protein [Yoonia sp.]|uniref:hypothetical protein n=1 Tax=Yoonia sp. TaxID=2212373 RepID=UPI0019DA0337|nr:hypothetical protein [Yoonia sp.]MBE0413082.1 hypothetical protein [Yoonia sp.]
MKKKLIAAGIAWFSLVGLASAQSAEVSDAVALWLTGNDAASLPALANDAKAGDITAQLILGQVDRDTIPGGYSDYLLGLSRTERAALLRADAADGSTVNWLLTFSDADKAALGDALFWYEANLDPIDAALDLQRVNEKSMAELVLWRTVNNGKFNLVQTLPADNGGLATSGFMAWVVAYFAGENRTINISNFLADERQEKVPGLLALKRLERVLGLGGNFSVGLNELITVMLGHGNSLPETADLVTLNAHLKRLAEVDPRVGVVDRMCNICPDSEEDYQCMIQTFEIIGGYETLLAVRTPAEAAVPADAYLVSDRATTALTDLVRGRAPKDASRLRSSCLLTLAKG